MPTTGRPPVPGGDAEIEASRAGPTGTVVSMEPPPDLTADAQDLWRVILPDLIALKVFRLSDAPMLAELCRSLGYARAFAAEIDVLTLELGKIAEGWRGAVPEEDSIKNYDLMSGTLKRARSGYTQMMRTAMNLAADFAVSPVSRLRLGLMVAKGNTLGALRDAIEKGETA